MSREPTRGDGDPAMIACSVILPACNEEHSIASVVEEVRRVRPGCEIIVVDDGLTDRTTEEAARAGAVTVCHPANGGYGLSLMDGIRTARHEMIAIADASYLVERIPDLVAILDRGFHMAVGARQRMQQHDSLLKIPARLFFEFLVEFTIGARISDIKSGLRRFRKSEVAPCFPDLCLGFSFTTALTLIYRLTGKFPAYRPIEYRRRVGTTKVHILRDSLRTLQYLVEVIATYNPLKLYLLLCLALEVLAATTSLARGVLRAPALLASSAICVGSAFLLFGVGVHAFLARC